MPSTVFQLAKITASIKKISTSVFDGLARPIQKQLNSDPDGVTSVDITYDADGRAATQSNPHRTSSSTTDGITTTLYDALNRVCLVAPADSASPPTSCPSASSPGTAFTSYSANCTTVTDEAGKSRTSCVDGLGRMTDVKEDPSGFNYDTAYLYDTLGNMKSVTQKGGATASGSWRTRSFTYNLLSQVTSSNNPESGIIGYTYDADGNAVTKTAPMHNQPSSGVTVTSTYSYDKLNRLIKESYSDGTATAQFGYDGAAIPSGCVTAPPTLADSFPAETRTSMCDGSGAASWKHDAMGRVAEERRTIGSVAGKFIEYTYNLDGSLSKLTTPPLKTVVYTPGGAGRPLSAVDSADSLNF